MSGKLDEQNSHRNQQQVNVLQNQRNPKVVEVALVDVEHVEKEASEVVAGVSREVHQPREERDRGRLQFVRTDSAPNGNQRHEVQLLDEGVHSLGEDHEGLALSEELGDDSLEDQHERNVDHPQQEVGQHVQGLRVVLLEESLVNHERQHVEDGTHGVEIREVGLLHVELVRHVRGDHSVEARGEVDQTDDHDRLEDFVSEQQLRNHLELLEEGLALGLLENDHSLSVNVGEEQQRKREVGAHPVAVVDSVLL